MTLILKAACCQSEHIPSDLFGVPVKSMNVK